MEPSLPTTLPEDEANKQENNANIEESQTTGNTDERLEQTLQSTDESQTTQSADGSQTAQSTDGSQTLQSTDGSQTTQNTDNQNKGTCMV